MVKSIARFAAATEGNTASSQKKRNFVLVAVVEEKITVVSAIMEGKSVLFAERNNATQYYNMGKYLCLAMNTIF